MNDPAHQLAPTPDMFDPRDSDQTCFLCEEPRYTLVHEVAHFGYPIRFQQCQCGLQKQTPMPNQAFFDWFFNSEVFFSSQKTSQKNIWGYHDYFADEPCRLATSRRRYRVLRRWFEERPGSNIMKIGPATGTMLHVLKQHGHQVLGCDVSNRFAQYAMQNYQVPIDIGRFEKQGYAPGQFDVVLLFNVIENVPNLDEFLREISRTLKPGGLLILNYVDMRANWVHRLQGAKYFLYRPPVCYVFERDVMRRTLAKYGMRVEQSLLDVRHLHLEKIATLLGWRWMWSIAKWMGVARVAFPIYAYPSRILVARRG